VQNGTMNTLQDKKEAFARLLTIMDDLREKCPWDKKQTIQTLRHLTIEETYELTDAILDENWEEIKGELGDILLHMVFYAKIAHEKKHFDIADVLQAVCDKLVYRHPHIYADVTAETEEEVKANWEKLKLQSGKKSVLEGVPKSLPAVVKAARIQEKVKGVGFDWETKDQVWEKVCEEINELKVEVDKQSDKMEEEFGDVLFSLINYARFIGINPESALERTNKKFIRRFQLMEALMANDGVHFATMKLNQMDVYWEKAKKTLKED
jgi:XTP/dITP diphosphohydrolase